MKFKDLEEVVSHKISVNLMPFDVLADFVKVTGDTVLVPITIQMKNRDITFVNKDGVQRGTVNIFGRVTTLTGQIAQTFEDTVQADIPAELLRQGGGKFAGLLESASFASRALPFRHRGQRRQRRSRWHLEQGHSGAGFRRRPAGRLLR